MLITPVQTDIQKKLPNSTAKPAASLPAHLSSHCKHPRALTADLVLVHLADVEVLRVRVREHERAHLGRND